ncbi:hypothetical protein ASH01_06740 [Terrabacter sp. Soil811]|nr:hypothetical protein ASH01_06740 [Terrabacter sp. Soil811]
MPVKVTPVGGLAHWPFVPIAVLSCEALSIALALASVFNEVTLVVALHVVASLAHIWASAMDVASDPF